MAQPIVFDVETQHAFQEVGHNLKKLKISVVGMFDYDADEYEVYTEKDLNEFFTRVEHASFLIGFNINHFDLPVLSPYYLGDIRQFETFDILEEVEKSIGFRVALDDLARMTLGSKKSGHGFTAINYFRTGQWEKLKKYCLEDVRITKDLYEFGKKNGKLKFQTNKGSRDIPVNFKERKAKTDSVSLSLPI